MEEKKIKMTYESLVRCACETTLISSSFPTSAFCPLDIAQPLSEETSLVSGKKVVEDLQC